jgi:hypothetical protein
MQAKAIKDRAYENEFVQVKPDLEHEIGLY